jgi:hypothetical protein
MSVLKLLQRLYRPRPKHAVHNLSYLILLRRCPIIINISAFYKIHFLAFAILDKFGAVSITSLLLLCCYCYLCCSFKTLTLVPLSSSDYVLQRNRSPSTDSQSYTARSVPRTHEVLSHLLSF